MARAKNIKQVLDKKHKRFDLPAPWKEILGNPGQTGIWLIYGLDKNGKTSFALQLAEMLSHHARSLYVSGEEGFGETFQDALNRCKLDVTNTKIQFLDYVPLPELKEILDKRQSARIVFIDNVTKYLDELKGVGYKALADKFEHRKLIIFLAHEDNKEPYSATAKMIKRFSKIYFHVVGNKAFAAGRCPGGEYTINDERAALYHGSSTE